MKSRAPESLPPHGSPAGYEAGCTTRAACPHHDSPTTLTCAEAAIRRRGDYQARRLPEDQPLARHTTAPGRPSHRARHATREGKHGTPWGYQRGCRTRTECPHWHAGRVTCADARREYFRDYKRRRREGAGSELDHGTTAGYSSGCHDASRCTRSEAGVSCAEAWRAYKLGKAREAGVRPRTTGEPHAARLAILELRSHGHSVRSIAGLTGVGRTTIGELLRTAGLAEPRNFSEHTIHKVVAAAGPVRGDHRPDAGRARLGDA